MSAFKGREALLEVATITSGVADTLRSIGGTQSYSFSESRELEEVSDLIKQLYPVTPDIEDTAFSNEVLPFESITCDCSGFYTDSLGEIIIREASGAASIVHIKFTFPDLSTISGDAYISSTSSDNSYSAAQSFSVAITFVGLVTKTGF